MPQGRASRKPGLARSERHPVSAAGMDATTERRVPRIVDASMMNATHPTFTHPPRSEARREFRMRRVPGESD